MKTLLCLGIRDVARFIQLRPNFDMCYGIDADRSKIEYLTSLFKYDPGVHLVHAFVGGSPKNSTGAPSIDIHAFCMDHGIDSVDTLITSLGGADVDAVGAMGPFLREGTIRSIQCESRLGNNETGITDVTSGITEQVRSVSADRYDALGPSYGASCETSDFLDVRWLRKKRQATEGGETGGAGSGTAPAKYVFNAVCTDVGPEHEHEVRRGNVSVILTASPLDGCDLYLYINAYSYSGKPKGYNTLLLAEPIVVLPGQYNENIWEHFDHIYTLYDTLIQRDRQFTKILLFRNGWPTLPHPITENMTERETLYPLANRKNAILMINGNKSSSTEGELYSKRIEAARWFFSHSDIPFDVYGNPPFFLPNYRGILPKESRYPTLAQYRYYLSFENMDHPEFALGYVEKILDCLETRTIPIYLGNPDIERYIPRECYIDFRDFGSYTALDGYLHSMSEKEYLNYIENIDMWVAGGGLRPYSWYTIYDYLAQFYASREGMEVSSLIGEDTRWEAAPMRQERGSPLPQLWTFQTLAAGTSQFTPQKHEDPFAGVARARDLANEGRFAEALQEMAWAPYSGNADLHFFCAQLMHCTSLQEAELIQLSIALGLNPNHAAAHNLLGVVSLDQKQYEKAEVHFQTSLSLDRTNALAWKNLAFLLLQTGRGEEATPIIKNLEPHFPEVREWIQDETPMDSPLTIDAALQVQMKGEFGKAEIIYRKILEREPKNSDAYHLLGIIAYQTNRCADAVSLFKKAIALNKANPAFFCNLGLAYFQSGDYSAAVEQYRHALKMHPRYPEACNNLGNAYKALGRIDEAVKCYRQSLSLNPASAETLYNMGAALHRAGQPAEAMECYKKAVALMPGSAEIYNNMGVLHQDMGEYELSMECCRHAISLRPDYAAAHSNLGTSLKESGEADEALKSYGRSLSLEDSPGTRIKSALALPIIMGSVEDIQKWRERAERQVDLLLEGNVSIEDPAQEVSASNFYLAYHGHGDRDLQVKIAHLYEKACPSLLFRAPHCDNGPRGGKGRKIRIGFVSRFLRNHTVGKYTKGIITGLAREFFDVRLYFTSESKDDLSRELVKTANKSVTLFPDLARARKQVTEDKLDILVYPEIGMDPFTYFLAFSRLAPVQCAFFGHPDTTGIRNMDFFLSHEGCEPGDSDAHYSERLFKTSASSAYAPYYRPIRGEVTRSLPDFGLNEKSHIYLCPHASFKIHPEADDLMRRILEGDPRGEIVLFEGLHAHWMELLRARFDRTMPHLRERIRVLPRMPHNEFLTLMSLAHVVLDMPHFSGGNTTFDAISAGVPVVALPGKFMRGRQTYALFSRMGIEDCIAHSPDAYVETAVRLANDPDLGMRVRNDILERNHLVFEDMGMVRDLEAFFLKTVES